MKNLNSSLFWKIYLTLLLVLFLPFVLFTMAHLVQNRGNMEPLGIARHMDWTASELAALADDVPDEDLILWIERMTQANDLDICVQRNERKFYLEESEWLGACTPETDEEHFLPGRPRPILSFAVSPSKRTQIATALHPFGRPSDADSGFNPMKQNSVMLMLMIPLCLFFSFMLMKNFLAPLREFQTITGKLASGDFSGRLTGKVTDRSDEIGILGKSFNKMTEYVENVISAQKRLLRDISHEIRSPLQRIEVATALLRKAPSFCAEMEKYTNRIELEVGRVDGMVEELLTLFLAEETFLMRSDPVALDEMVHSIIEDAVFENNLQKGIIAANLQKVSVSGDALLLSRALSNVIHNAIRYTEPGTSIEIDMRQEGKQAVIKIKDHGRGVPEDELDKIFLPFYRTDEARERSHGGTGLGLCITKRIIEAHSGRIAASNDPTGGLTVTIFIGGAARALASISAGG